MLTFLGHCGYVESRAGIDTAVIDICCRLVSKLDMILGTGGGPTTSHRIGSISNSEVLFDI